jgi:hypothetical protein
MTDLGRKPGVGPGTTGGDMADVWNQLKSLFDTDDGSLRVIQVNGLGRDGVGASYAFIRSWCRTKPDNIFWHSGLDQDERLDAWPDAALLVADGEADPFHFLASGIAFDGVVIPDLGVFVFPGEVRLDYRMGSEWNEGRVLALFELLRRLAAFSPDAWVTLEPAMLPSVERRFQAAFSAYCEGQPPVRTRNPSLPEAGRMTERQWRECNDPDAMLALLGKKVCQRRLRLFSAACCRRVWHLLEEPALRKAVEAAERFAVGQATSEELKEAWQASLEMRKDDGLSDDPLANARFWAADAASQAASDLDRASAVANSAAWACSWASVIAAETAFDRERAVQCRLLRCIFGDPFRLKPTIEPVWLVSGDGAVPRLAREIDESRCFTDLPILADALLDVGCSDERLLAHLREPGPHARGCHILDLFLGRTDR